ncbi:MAG: 50S ribosomal protein L35 [Patescibacteria group bacterium]
MKLKTNKTVSKRFRITRTGKILKCKCGRGHFNARESGNVTRAKRKLVSMSQSYHRAIKEAIK